MCFLGIVCLFCTHWFLLFFLFMFDALGWLRLQKRRGSLGIIGLMSHKMLITSKINREKIFSFQDSRS